MQKECERNFPEISEITRISAIKLRTFASEEKAAKIRCFYSDVGEILQARCLIETKFSGIRRNFVAKFRARWTKFRVIRTKFCFDEAKFRLGETNNVWTRRNYASTKRNSVCRNEISSSKNL